MNRLFYSIISGLIVGALAMGITVNLTLAAPPTQADKPTTTPGTSQSQNYGVSQKCMTCHLDVTNHWKESPHAHAFDDPYFQQSWVGMGSPGDCLVCHTTNYQATTGQFSSPGVTCESCHGPLVEGHPSKPMPIRANTEYCGTCHTTTYSEWSLTGHATAKVDCKDCHNPHTQKPLFENSDELCINCHKESMGPYLETTHGQKGIGCVDCHALVIPPAETPKDGIVPTGHAFTITPATCVACHTDSLHSGFSLPGYESGAKKRTITDTLSIFPTDTPAKIVHTAEEQIQSLENQIQVLEAASATRNTTVLFQGGLIGLVLGGTTAWIVATNVKRGRKGEPRAEEPSEE